MHIVCVLKTIIQYYPTVMGVTEIKWKMTPICWQMEDNFIFFQMEEDLNFFKWKTISFLSFGDTL